MFYPIFWVSPPPPFTANISILLLFLLAAGLCPTSHTQTHTHTHLYIHHDFTDLLLLYVSELISEMFW
jgi:hypothetical protein